MREVRVGASGWAYVVPYRGDLAAALQALRGQVFESGEYVEPERYGFPAADSLEEIVSEPFWEFMGTCGTHSIIDVLDVDDGDGEQEFGTIRPLTEAECVELFGAASPGRSDYETVCHTEFFADFATGGRWTGRSAVLWAEGKPSEIAFWGCSGD